MFVRTNASRQNCRLGRSISRLSYLSGSLSSSPSPSPSPLASTRLLSTRRQQQPRPWQRPTVAVSTRDNPTSVSERAFATAVSDLPITVANPNLSKLYTLRPIDPTAVSDFIALSEPKRSPPPARQTKYAISGEVDVNIDVFDACVRLGQLDRAASVLIRLEGMEGLEPEQLISMHNSYLGAWVRQLKADPGVGKAEDLHAWYERHVHTARLPQTPETIAYMLKASLLTTATDGTRLTRLINRYMDMVPPDQGLDVLYCTDILTDPDIAAITKLYPEFNVAGFEGEFEDSDIASEDRAEIAAALPEPLDISDDGSVVPNVLETPQKGSGLSSVKSTLQIFQKMKDGYDISLLPNDERLEFQSRLEADCVEAAMQRWREVDENLRNMGVNTFMNSSSMNSWLWVWHQDLEAWFENEFKLIKKTLAAKGTRNREDSERCNYGPIIMQSTPARLAALTTLSVLNTMAHAGADRGIGLTVVLSSLARVAEEDIQVLKFQETKTAEARKRKVEWARERRRKAQEAAEVQAQNDGQTQDDGLQEAEEASEGQVQNDGQTRDDGLHEAKEASEGQVQNDGQTQDDGLQEAKEATEIQVQNDGQTQDDVEQETKVAAGESEVPRLADGESTTHRRRTWPLSLRTKLAAVLLSALAEVAKVRVVREHAVTKKKVTSMQPAFTWAQQFRRGKRLGVLLAHPTLAETMRKEPRADFLARHLPMVVKPKPWSEFDVGGYIESPVPIIRVKAGEHDQRLYAEAAIARGDMEQVMKGLDVLGKTAWRINRPVFDVFLDAWNTGEAIAKVPPLNPDIPNPEEPDTSASPLERRNWIKALKAVANLKSGYHSSRCFMNFQLEIARAFRDQEFFFPHNVDFRGRAYPIPTYLNHMGADHVRGLLRFSKGRELGERGLMWLKVHLANVAGFDKASLKGRAAFADENLPHIIDSATNPLKGERWWLEAEDPWQCLAACFELKAAMELPDPTKYVSSLPVHQDGTCNGLQHYAALGGDTWGAQQVNLLPGDKPADVYTAVAELVKAGIDEDVKLDHPNAKAMLGKIKRKVVKQTVMTNVYGVTFNGAKKQVLKQINAFYPNLHEETGVHPGSAASYVATRIFKALATMFKGAHDIQYWLGEIGSRVCRALTAEQLDQLAKDDIEPGSGSNKPKKIVSRDDILSLCRSTIVWTTPLRMPVVQPYRKNSSRIVDTCIQSFVLSNPDRFDPVHRRKQLQAFPPNFIHSLDASHMLLSALECNELGLSFAAVHDSFWTHAADVDDMNRVLRDAFIRIHSEDVIKRLAAEFEARYKGGLYSAQVETDSNAGIAILKWRRSERLNGREEVLLEKKRLDLLNSDDPVKQEEGKAMVTAGSLYEKWAPTREANIIREDVSATALGSISNAAPDVDAEDDPLEGTLAGEGAEDEDSAAGEYIGEHQTAEDAPHRTEELEKLEAWQTGNKNSFVDSLEGKPRSPSKKKIKATNVWLPLSFPDVPEKGDFDVKQLKDSDYFFS